MKKILLSFSCLLLLLFLASCRIQISCLHVDKNDDFYCDECGDVFDDGPQNHTHSFIVKSTDAKYLMKEADCESCAVYYYSCNCGEKGSNTFNLGDPLGHTVVIDIEATATCTTPGYTASSYCSVCNKVLEERVETSALGHREVSTGAVAPTCTLTGKTAYVYCSVCQEVLEEQSTIPELGHDIRSYEAKVGCTGIGWDPYVACTRCSYSTKLEVVLTHSYANGECIKCGDPDPSVEIPPVVDPDDETPYVKSGNYIYFGEYPQSIKADKVTIYKETQDARGYYLGSDGFYYAAVTAKPAGTGYLFTNNVGIVSGVVYYFKVEPIKWRILLESGGEAFLLCDSIIANMAYQSKYSYKSFNYYTSANGAPENTYMNNYKYSEVRQWLNDNFYKAAFTEKQQSIILNTVVNNSEFSTVSAGSSNTQNKFACENTQDKVFLISQNEVTNSMYGFLDGYTDDSARRIMTTDYTRACGGYMNTTAKHYGNGLWWLRSPDTEYSHYVRTYGDDGHGGSRGTAYYTGAGVVPALRIKL